MNSEFVTSCVNASQWPDTDLPEIVVVGRSNVGKSSFINALCNKKKLAYVGNTPGKTRLINFFNIDQKWMLVDVPGYGYAKMSKAMLIQMGEMMEEYFSQRKQLKAVISLVDSRHDVTKDDIEMISSLKENNIPIIVVATKIDKVSKTKRVKALKVISQSLQIPLKNIYGVSSTEKIGFEEVLNKIYEVLEI
ncbi:ribosome biogenesis GTP-binding protein YihA/YsxC [Floccifex sp.]|uniref:ribosome biogenesis GTP-binding protein YihA/YsxC n=1 Tax=Floccifex sp. TaxID=2815810 RepID=UPI002A74D614|nr:ribosome biogenesis GTP-binding protein YihA/YsxC [Floccifex sp.]MDD7281108.1 ribosome biogenesis GTP-binding protein YihA/YsxC [Erysipelotrichaceae bacterium]MDY2957563.1 ribosome biogenesis GTP-binding protein YihA/YsxC [Floccifex sp.]